MVAVTIQGADALTDHVRALGAALPPAVCVEDLTIAAEAMRQAAEDLAPRGDDPPHLADHIRTVPMTDDAGRPAVAVGPIRGYEYGIYQEYGTIYHPAQPFMRPAFDAGVHKTLQRFGREAWARMAAAR